MYLWYMFCVLSECCLMPGSLCQACVLFSKGWICKIVDKIWGRYFFDPEDDLPLHVILTNHDSDKEDDDDDIPLADLIKLCTADVEA